MDVHIGIDDTDSPRGFCTTYLGFLLSLEFKARGFSFLDLPYLVRLNPNVPFKTRGNAAVSIHLSVPEDKLEEIKSVVVETLLKNVEDHGKVSPGFAIATGKIHENLHELYLRALREYVPQSYVMEKVKEGFFGKVEVGGLRSQRGVVGALAALGAYPLEQYTYELLVYRNPAVRGEKRGIEESLLLGIDRKYRPVVFGTYDYAERRAPAVPRGPDPVLLGLRALNADMLVELFSLHLEGLVRSVESVGYIIYKTNQATDAHLGLKKPIHRIRPYDSVVIEGHVSGKPEVLTGGHVKIKVCEEEECVDVMFYRETGRLNRVARLLKPGDKVQIGGGVLPRKTKTLNAEVIRVVHLEDVVICTNPVCPKCGARMKSAGSGKGYKCPKCGYHSKMLSKVCVKMPRILEPGLYVSSVRAYRHLTKPKEIYGLSSTPSQTLAREGNFVGLVLSKGAQVERS
ncbi:MAG: tRNA(Ile)(2)-agmatinylcytidine synthase [Infirmifilum sp.]